MNPRPLAPDHGPLTGVTVVDFSRLLPGPYATQVLADLGARVIKVEDPEGGDYLRNWPPLVGNTGAQFLALNRGKESVALDLKSEGGRASALELIRKADVVVESFRPGVMDRLGLGYAQSSGVNPGIIYCSISGFGQSGADAHKAGHDLSYAVRSGVLGYMHKAGPLPVQVGDMAGAMWALVQIQGALVANSRGTPKATHIDVSMVESAWSFMVMPTANHLAAGVSPKPGGDLLNGGVPAYNVYEAADGVGVSVAALEPKFWMEFCHVMDHPDWALDGLETGARGQEVMEEMQKEFGAKPSTHWRAFFEKVDCCVEVVRRPQDVLLEDPTLANRSLVARVELEPGRRVQLPVTPLRMSGYSPNFARPAPALGQHTEQHVTKPTLDGGSK